MVGMKVGNEKEGVQLPPPPPPPPPTSRKQQTDHQQSRCSLDPTAVDISRKNHGTLWTKPVVPVTLHHDLHALSRSLRVSVMIAPSGECSLRNATFEIPAWNDTVERPIKNATVP